MMGTPGKPVASVVMPVRNGEATIADAVQSVLRQSLEAFELIVVDDGSNDGTADYLASLTDPRLRIIRLARHEGIVAALNRGLREAQGRYVCRMDADDIARPDRLQTQLAFMESHPDIDVCGSFIDCFDGGGRTATRAYPLHDDDIKATLVFENSLAHPTVVYRADALQRCDMAYQPGTDKVEDYALWVSCKDCVKFANLPQPLLAYRLPVAAGPAARPERREKARQVRERVLQGMGLSATTEQLALHHAIAEQRSEELVGRMREVAAWLDGLLVANGDSQAFDHQALSRLLSRRYFDICQSVTLRRWSACWRIRTRPAGGVAQMPVARRLRLTARQLWQMAKQHCLAGRCQGRQR